MLNCTILKVLVNFDGILKNFRKSVPNIDKPYLQAENRLVTGIPFRNQEFLEKIDQNLKKLNKSIKF